MSERPVDELEQLKSAFDELDSAYVDLLEQNKRYREAIDKIKGELYKMSAWGKEEISMLDIIYDLEGEG